MNNFIIDYNNKKLILIFESQVFFWDLLDGDTGDFWHSFTDISGKVYDINFYQEDMHYFPSFTIYETSLDSETLMIKTDQYVSIEIGAKIGDPYNYFFS